MNSKNKTKISNKILNPLVYDMFKHRPNKDQISIFVEEISQSKDLFDATIDLIINEPYTRLLGPSWAIGYAGILKPNWFFARLPEIYSSLNSQTPNYIYRSVARVIRDTEIPDEYLGIITQKGFDWLTDPKQAIAVRVFSLHTLSKILDKEPELAIELKGIIETIMPNASSGMLNALASEATFSLSVRLVLF